MDQLPIRKMVPLVPDPTPVSRGWHEGLKLARREGCPQLDTLPIDGPARRVWGPDATTLLTTA